MSPHLLTDPAGLAEHNDRDARRIREKWLQRWRLEEGKEPVFGGLDLCRISVELPGDPGDEDDPFGGSNRIFAVRFAGAPGTVERIIEAAGKIAREWGRPVVGDKLAVLPTTQRSAPSNGRPTGRSKSNTGRKRRR